MLEATNYRGPDDSRIVVAVDFVVGFNRLAIVDTMTNESQQPYVTLKGRTVAFNGELYNYRDLQPRAHSEVKMLGDMLDYGADPRQYLDGDYAIIYHDPSNAKVTLYRDRFGACPLYYQTRPYLAVSSERRRLIAPREVLPFERVVLSYDRKNFKARGAKRDQMRHYGVTKKHGALDTFLHLLFDAVRSRAIHSEVGFSITCSGGLDSSLIVLAAHAQGLKPSELLCVSWGETEDLLLARKIAHRVHMPLNEILVNDFKVNCWRHQIAEHMDLTNHEDARVVRRSIPTGMAWRVAVRNWFVAQHATSRVILTGEGADELFDGYPPHPERLKVPYKIAHKQLSQVRSLRKCSLELSNKMGLAFSREFRAPFLESTLSYWLLATETGARKAMMREALRQLGAPEELLARAKWGKNEERLDASIVAGVAA